MKWGVIPRVLEVSCLHEALQQRVRGAKFSVFFGLNCPRQNRDQKRLIFRRHCLGSLLVQFLFVQAQLCPEKYPFFVIEISILIIV